MPERRTVPSDFLRRLVALAGGVEVAAEALGTPPLCVRMAIDGEITLTEHAFVRVLAAMQRDPATPRQADRLAAAQVLETLPVEPAAQERSREEAGAPPRSLEDLVASAGGIDGVAKRIGVTARVIEELLVSGRPLPEWFLEELRSPRGR